METMELMHKWSCVDAFHQPCPLTDLQDHFLNVPGNALAPGVYNFTLRAWRPGAGEANAGLGSWLMEVVEAELPAGALVAPVDDEI